MTEDQYAAANEARLTVKDIAEQNAKVEQLMGKAQDPSGYLRSMRQLARRLIWHIDYALGENTEQS